MAATAWEFYNSFKQKLGSGQIDLTGTNTAFRMRLYTSASNAATATLVTAGEVTGEVNSSAYQGNALTVNWSAKSTASTYAFTFLTVIFTASGTAINQVKYAVIVTQTASILVCWSQLSTAEFNVAAGNELVIEPNPVAFELS